MTKYTLVELPLTKKQKALKPFHLEVEQSVLVPSTKGVDKPVSQGEMKKRIGEVQMFLGKKFGGYTEVTGVGGYYSEAKKKLIKERIAKVTSYASASGFKGKEQELLKQLGSWGKKWGQESMGYEFEGDLYYIPQSFAGRRKMLKMKLRRKK